MPITIAGSGTITGISAGGLPDDSIIAADIAAGAVTTAKVADANITAAKLDGAQSGSAPIYAARAWVNFNGTGTVAIRASGNVSSITDNGTGDYTVNFTTAMPDANYSITTAYRRSGGALGDQNMVCTAPTFGTTPATSNVRVGTTNAYGGGREDTDYLSVAIFR
jgi:hypothetical protein